jgi:hypothetical protein
VCSVFAKLCRCSCSTAFAKLLQSLHHALAAPTDSSSPASTVRPLRSSLITYHCSIAALFTTLFTPQRRGDLINNKRQCSDAAAEEQQQQQAQQQQQQQSQPQRRTSLTPAALLLKMASTSSSVSPLPSVTAAGGNGRANGYWTGGDAPRGGASTKIRRVVRRAVQGHRRTGSASSGRGDATGRVEDGDEERCSVDGDYADLGMHALFVTYILCRLECCCCWFL